MTFPALPALALLLLPLATLADNERLPYTCDNGSQIEISFSSAADGRPQAILHFADDAITLPQVPAASGALYRAQDIALHTKADEAFFEDGKGNARHCLRGNLPPASAVVTKPPAVSSFLDIGGSVAYRLRIALPPDAVLIVRVQDVSRAGAPARVLAEQRIELNGQQVPIPFMTTVDRDLIGKKARVTVAARIEHRGKLLFVSDKSYPALSNGQPHHVEIQLKQVTSGKAR
jgi:putative lipoprotein